MLQLYLGVLSQLVRFIPADMPVTRWYEKGTEPDRLFARHLALFLTGFFKSHAELMEAEELRCVRLYAWFGAPMMCNLHAGRRCNLACNIWWRHQRLMITR